MTQQNEAPPYHLGYNLLFWFYASWLWQRARPPRIQLKRSCFVSPSAGQLTAAAVLLVPGYRADATSNSSNSILAKVDDVTHRQCRKSNPLIV